MKMNFNICFQIFLIALMLPVLSKAQDFQASVSKNRVAVGEVFTLSYSADRNLEDLKLPRLSDFRLVGGPFQQFRQSITNGKAVTSFTISYSLMAQSKGKFIIGPASAKSGGQTITSNQVEIEVSGEGSTAGAANPQNNQNQRGNEAAKAKAAGNDMFLVVTASKSTAMVGEQILITYKLYTKYGDVRSEDFQFPSYKNLWIQEIKDSGDKTFSIENYNGERYYTAVIQKNIIIPQKPGVVEVGPFTGKYLVQVVERTGDLFKDFFNGGEVKQYRKELKSNTLKINVQELPSANVPASFNGAVGDLTFDFQIDKTEVNTNDAITVKIKISGSGNLPLIENPGFSFPESFEKYDPKSSDKITVKESGISGSRTFEFIGIPRNPGTYKIPATVFSFYNPATKSYKTMKSDSLVLKVSGQATTNTGIVTQKEDVEMLSNDIRYIKSETVLEDKNNRFFLSWNYILMVILLIGTAVFLYNYRNVVRRKQNDYVYQRAKSADSVATKRLKHAKKLMEESQFQPFYEECYKAILGYIGDKTNIGIGELSKDRIKEIISAKKDGAVVAQEVARLLETCEFARFTPMGTNEQVSDFYNNCVQQINKLESIL
jgi:hypothetical protein